VKTSADQQESNATFEIGPAHLQRYCEVVLGKNTFSTLAR